MTDELVKRLRSMHWCVTTEANGVGVSDRKVASEAADRIETSEEQNLRLWGMVHDLRKEVAISDALLISEAEASLARLARAEKAEAERDRLREALNQSRLAFAGHVSVQSAIDMIDRAALKGETP